MRGGKARMDLEIIERIQECQNAEEVYFVP